MKVRDLIQALLKETEDLDREVVLQKNYPEGFSHHQIVFQFKGHPGTDAVVLHVGDALEGCSASPALGAPYGATPTFMGTDIYQHVFQNLINRGR